MEDGIKNLIYTIEMHHISSKPILDLIDKNKELEEYKNSIISKVKEKIEEFKKVRDILNSELNPDIKYDLARNDYCIKMLEELVEEIGE